MTSKPKQSENYGIYGWPWSVCMGLMFAGAGTVYFFSKRFRSNKHDDKTANIESQWNQKLKEVQQLSIQSLGEPKTEEEAKVRNMLDVCRTIVCMNPTCVLSNVVTSDSPYNVIGKDGNKAIPASRPVARSRTVDPPPDMSRIWFGTHKDSRKYHDMITSKTNNFACFTFYNAGDKDLTYCSVYGEMSEITDKNEVKKHWIDGYKAIYPEAAGMEGEPAPNFVVLELDVKKIEMSSYRFQYRNMQTKGWTPFVLRRTNDKDARVAQWKISDS